MNSSNRSFARFFLPGQSIASMFFMVYLMLPNISLLLDTPNSQLRSRHSHYLRNLSHTYSGEDGRLDRNKVKKKTRGVEQMVARIISGGRKKKKNKSNMDEFYENEFNNTQEDTHEEAKPLTDEDIDEYTNCLALYPHRSDICSVWSKMCGNEVNKFYDVINHFFTLYDEIKKKYKVRKENFRENIWEYFDEIVIKQLPNIENYFENLINDLINEKPLTKYELMILIKEYRIVCTNLREELFSQGQVEIAQAMMQIPWWKDI
ncbi:hypothetical protein AK88_02087 [Plasmodium fragile]|uniref:Plasmodium RESA N-terminal domain-containing protein n=1 Tax=Plasmodium fragile TaxID=5857 RepID=A0A0D9QRK4_PLAFR|nr:uncharacterized protein AK88_02087 [Plasmodium fragile]KJP88306.1 hypothetical protein AK88_02087 [Plasmodium fragile]